MRHIDWPYEGSHFVLDKPGPVITQEINGRTRDSLGAIFQALGAKAVYLPRPPLMLPDLTPSSRIAEALSEFGRKEFREILGATTHEQIVQPHRLPGFRNLDVYGVRNFSGDQLREVGKAVQTEGHRQLPAGHPIILLQQLGDHAAGIGIGMFRDRLSASPHCDSTVINY